MKMIFATKDTHLLLCFFIILSPAGVVEAKLLNEEQAKVWPHFFRTASVVSSTAITTFSDPNNLGKHGYKRNLSEHTGVVYTCKAGHIDLGHLRKTADWTAYLATKNLQHLKKNETEFTFKLYEPSLYHVQLTYSKNWKDLSPKEKEPIEYDISIRLGQYFAYTAATWHEIVTWFGYKSLGFIPEFESAFSWEDTFSNLLGSHIAVSALRDTEYEYDEAMTLALDRELKKLDVQPRAVAIRAAELVKGLWYSADLVFVGMKRRNFDVGIDDGFVTPWIVPSLPDCAGAQVQPYPVPDTDFLSEYGFSIKLEIEPREWEKNKILNAVYPDGEEIKKCIEPDIHFAAIMDYIKKDAAKRYGPDVGIYYATEETPSASMSLQMASDTVDLNKDGAVNMKDLFMLADSWLSEDMRKIE